MVAGIGGYDETQCHMMIFTVDEENYEAVKDVVCCRCGQPMYGLLREDINDEER
jgi:hypothetical protein